MGSVCLRMYPAKLLKNALSELHGALPALHSVVYAGPSIAVTYTIKGPAHKAQGT
jgi:hypothetical protein